MDLYRRKEWKAFCSEVIRLHDGRCSHCLCSKADGAVLQVHHKLYVDGRKPWEYSYSDCEVLCKGCHAKEHGIIMPTDGWLQMGVEDLGGLYGACDYCETELRHVHLITHHLWGSMEVGVDCCDKLTGTTDASDYHRDYMRRLNRRKTFVESPRWIRHPDGGLVILQRDISVAITPKGNGKFVISLDGVKGKVEHATPLDAQISAFDFVESGEAAKFLAEHLRKQLDLGRYIKPMSPLRRGVLKRAHSN